MDKERPNCGTRSAYATETSLGTDLLARPLQTSSDDSRRHDAKSSSTRSYS